LRVRSEEMMRSTIVIPSTVPSETAVEDMRKREPLTQHQPIDENHFDIVVRKSLER